MTVVNHVAGDGSGVAVAICDRFCTCLWWQDYDSMPLLKPFTNI